MKTCRLCELSLPAESFPPRRRICWACKRAQSSANAKTAASRERRRARSAERYRQGREIMAALKDRPCMDCGGRFPPYVMEFDHPDPTTKLLNIGMSAGGGMTPKLRAEIEKCDVVCANCHKIRTRRMQRDGVLRLGGRPRKMSA